GGLNNHDHLAEGNLRLRHVVDRLWFSAERTILHVANHADNFPHRRILIFERANARLYSFSNNVFIWEMQTRKRFAHDYYLRRLVLISLIEIPAFAQRYSHCFEISGIYDEEIRSGLIFRRDRSPVDFERDHEPITTQRQRV